MSSYYHLLCMAHDPAIVIDVSANHPEQALAAIADRTTRDALREHPHCPLMIGRYSAAMIELCCPGSQHDHPRSDKWEDTALLRVVAVAAMQEPSKAMIQALEALGRLASCWAPERLRRLRYELLIEEP